MCEAMPELIDYIHRVKRRHYSHGFRQFLALYLQQKKAPIAFARHSYVRSNLQNTLHDLCRTLFELVEWASNRG